MKLLLRVLSLAILPLAFTDALQAQQERVVVFPVEAIADSARLNREAYLELYPGIDATQFGLTDEGWYVRYRHELLTYVYGPIEDLDYARRQKKLLEEIRLSAVLKSPTLSSSKIDLVRFDFDGSPPRGEAIVEDNPYLRPELKNEE